MLEDIMNRNHLHHPLAMFLILAAIVACVLPGQASAPAPGTDPLTIESAVAGTAQAAEQQTRQANPVPATATITPTDAPTRTPKISLTGTSLLVREDQSTVFIDYRAGFQIIIPAGWLATRVNEEEYFSAFALDVVLTNPPINDRLAKIQSNNTDYFRLDAIDIRPGHVVNGMISDITVILQPESASRTLEEWAKHERQRPSPFEGHKFLSSEFKQTANGIRILVTEESWNFDQEGKVYARRVFFSMPTGTVTIDFQTYLDFKDVVLPDFEQVVNSVTLLNP